MKVALSQHAPVYLDLNQTLEKAISIIEEAAREKCKLLVFGETWLTGYPQWLDYAPSAAVWDYGPTKEVFAKMHENSVTVPGPSLSLLQEKAKQFKLNICIGINEKVEASKGHGTLYNSFVIIDDHGKLIHHHRKLMPTYTEKMIYGLGDARGIKTVNISGWNLGGLICWEHWMPLTRQALHDKGEQIHVALWPRVHEMHQIASRHYAFEGRCYVLAVGQIMGADLLPDNFELPSDFDKSPENLLLNGGSCIIGPNGQYIHPPIYDQECLVTATLDLKRIREEQMTLDVSGHYSRPDIFDFNIRK